MLQDLAQDLRYALRRLRAEPRFSAFVVLVLALGIGANTAIFSAIDAAFLKPLPFPSADRLVSIADASLPLDVAGHAKSSPTIEDFAADSVRVRRGRGVRERWAQPHRRRDARAREDHVRDVAVLRDARPARRVGTAAGARGIRQGRTGGGGDLARRLAARVRRTECRESHAGVERQELSHRRRHAVGFRFPRAHRRVDPARAAVRLRDHVRVPQLRSVGLHCAPRAQRDGRAIGAARRRHQKTISLHQTHRRSRRAVGAAAPDHARRRPADQPHRARRERRAPSAHRVRERDEPAPLARGRPPARAGHPCGSRRHAAAHHSTARRGEPSPRRNECGDRCRRRAGLRCACCRRRCPRVSPTSRRPAWTGACWRSR